MSLKPKRVLPLEVKFKIIQRLNRGEKIGKLAEEYGVGRTTVHDMYKSRAKIESFLSNANLSKKRKNMRRVRNLELEEALYEWYTQEKKTGAVINSSVLIARAKELYKEIYNKDNFIPKESFLTVFKRRYRIRFTERNDLPDDTTNDSSNLEEFKNVFFKKLYDMELCPSQVYIATESELCWRILPSNGFGGNEKNRVTFLACTNASGLHKLKLLIIGNSNKSREFGNVNLPVHYFGQKICRATEETFRTWFYECFSSETSQWLRLHNLPEKVLLLVDSSICNSVVNEYTTDDQSITTIFYPTEYRDVMPLDQDLLNDIKQKYKKKLLLSVTARDLPLETSIRQYTMKDMFFSLTESWSRLCQSKIIESWKRIWPNMALQTDSDFPEILNEASECSLLRSVAGDLLLPVDELQKWFDGEEDSYGGSINERIFSNQEEDRAIEICTETVSREDAVESFDKCILWAEQNGSSSDEIGLLRKLRDKALISFQNQTNSEIHVADNDIFH